MKQGWEIKKLGEVCNLYQPRTISGEMLVEDGKYLVYGANGIIGRYNEYNHENSEVLLTCRGATCGTINVSEPYSWINGNAMVVQPKNDNIGKIYLQYLLQAVDWGKVITGAAQPQITRQSLSPLDVIIPPREEQERIVAELDCLSGVIEKKKEQLRELDALAQSIFYDMFGDPIINEKGWEVKNINEVCSIFGRIGFRGYTTNDLVSSPKDGAISLSPSNIINNHLDYSKCTYISWYKYEESPEIKICNEDILLVKTGSSYGKCALVENLPHKATINPQFVVLKNIKINNRYLTSCLQSPSAKCEFDKFTIGAAIPTFSQKNLGNMQIILPPMELQREFADKIEAIEKQKELIKDSLRETEALFNERLQHWFEN